MIFFLKKQLINFHLPISPFHSAKFKKNSQGRSRVMRLFHFWAQNGPFVMNNFFLVQTIIITFIYLLALFMVQNLKKILQWIQSYEDVPFLGPKCSICPTQNFFGKLLISLSPTYQPLSLCKILKKFLEPTQSQEDVQFLGPKWPTSPNENFFRKIFK